MQVFFLHRRRPLIAFRLGFCLLPAVLFMASPPDFAGGAVFFRSADSLSASADTPTLLATPVKPTPSSRLLPEPLFLPFPVIRPALPIAESSLWPERDSTILAAIPDYPTPALPRPPPRS